MEEPKGNSGEEKPDKKNPANPLIKKDVKSTPTNETKDSEQGKKPQTIDSEPVRIVIEKDKRGNGVTIAGTIIAGLALIAACIALYYNQLLYSETKTANQTSAHALQLNRDQFAQSKIDNEVNRKAQAQKDLDEATEATKKSIEDQMRFREQLALQQQTATAQINSLKEQQSEFKKANDSYLQISNIVPDSLNENKPVSITYMLSNLGQPAKVLDGVVYILVADKGAPIPMIQNATKTMPQGFKISNTYVIKEDPQIQRIHFAHNVPKDVIESIKKGQTSVFIKGQFRYLNLVTNKPKEYSYTIEYNFLTKEATYWEAENKP